MAVEDEDVTLLHRAVEREDAGPAFQFQHEERPGREGGSREKCGKGGEERTSHGSLTLLEHAMNLACSL
jgi:hypothetical protein